MSLAVFRRHRTDTLYRAQPSRSSIANVGDSLYGPSQPAAVMQPADKLVQDMVLPQLQPISRTLAREFKQEQQLKKRLRKQIGHLQRQWQLMNSSTTLAMQQAIFVSSSSSINMDVTALSEDPLFSTGTPPSVEQLQRRLVLLQDQLEAGSESVSNVLTAATRLQEISQCLHLSIELVVPMVARHEQLLLEQPQALPPRLALLASVLQLPEPQAGQLLAATAPQLLATPLQKLQASVVQLQRVLSSRGLNVPAVLQARPDLLCQSPASIERKLEELPVTLGMSRQHIRQLVAECPQLLRRSVATLQRRYHNLVRLLNIPESFVGEFVVQEPELLCISAATLKAKFDSLLNRYGAFSDDVVDMVLVDPAMLLNADPAAAPAAPAIKPSRKKQQQQQQQQQQPSSQLQQVVASTAPQQREQKLLFGSITLGADLASGAEAANSLAADGSMSGSELDELSGADQQPPQQLALESDQPVELWRFLLQHRQQKQQAARTRQRLQRQWRRQQQQGLDGLGQPKQGVQKLSAAGTPVNHAVCPQHQSPVRKLLAFAAATGLNLSKALLLWQQEPMLAQLSTAAIQQQVGQLSAALGLDSSDGIQQWQKQQQQRMSAAAADSQSMWSTTTSSSNWQQTLETNSSSSSRPILQALMQEPALLVLPASQVQVNMQGLCYLLGLDSKQLLRPVLWQQPGLLQLAPEIAEFRLQHLAGLLQLSVPRAVALVLQQPQLLVERPVLLAARIGSLCTLLGVQRGVASECVLREPLLLCVDDAELQDMWQQLCSRVGWADNAVDLVLADPAALMRMDARYGSACTADMSADMQ